MIKKEKKFKFKKKKNTKINFYDKKVNIIHNPNLDDSDIEYYHENGKRINT